MSAKYLIWDLPLRIFHWLLVISIFGSWYTSNQDNGLIDYHLTLGYFTLGLVVFRLVWGFVGTTHSRFSQFIPSLGRLIAYAKSFRSPSSPSHPGHNPMGSLMVVFMLTIILLQAISGLFMNDDIFTSGPYYGTLDENMESIAVFIHRNGFNVIIGAVVLHIAAIIFYQVFKGQSLVPPMLTGKKSSDDVTKKDSISHSKIGLAILITLLVAAFIYWLVVINAPVIEEYYY
jgi:cytochrome b